MKRHILKKALRMSLMPVLFIFIAFVMIAFVSCIFAVDIIERETRVSADIELSLMDATIQSKLRELEVSTLSAAVAVQIRLDNRQIQAQIDDYIRDLNAGMQPDGDNLSGFLFIGGFITGEFHAGVDWTPPTDYDPQMRPWYEAAVRAEGDLAMVGPYTDARTGMRVVSCSKLLIGSSGDNYGVLFVDLLFDELSSYVVSPQYSSAGYGMILSAEGNILAYPDESRLDREFGKISPAHMEIEEQILAETPFITSRTVVNSLGDRVVTFYQRISNDWYIGIGIPYEQYYKDVYYMVGILVVMALLSAFVMNYFVIRTSMDKIRSDTENSGKSSFLARMSHEIRTPLNSILGMCEIIGHKKISPEIAECVSIIAQSGNALLTIIDDILDFSKIDAGQMNIANERYYFASTINDVVNVIRLRLVDKPLMFSVKVDSAIPEQLLGDEVRIRQILMNLLGNAVKYTDAGHISLEVHCDDLGDGNIRLTFVVEDSGIGIHEEDMDKLFQDFSRIENPRFRGIEGSGLGLAITHSLCKAMRGDIFVESKYGSGTTFTATVLQKSDPDNGARLAAVQDAGAFRALVLEERPIDLDAIRYVMTGLGIHTDYAADTDDFIRRLESDAYTHAFVASKFIDDCLAARVKGKPLTELVDIVEIGMFSKLQSIFSIIRPVFCLNVANIFNNKTETAVQKSKNNPLHFTAPTAKALIVDDFATNLSVSKELVSLFGLRIDTSMRGAEAVELTRMNRYDIVFMDHMMPGMDGVEAAKAIRAIDPEDDYYQSLPIIALTANAISGQREMLLQNGMNGYIAKPIELKKLGSVLWTWLPVEKLIRIEEPDAAADGRLPGLAINGIDIDAGLTNLGGSADVYLSILSDFCRDADAAAQQIEACAARGERALYMTLVHALKGTAMSIGAAEFAGIAERLENAAREKDDAAIQSGTPGLLLSLRTLTGSIREGLLRRADSAPPQTNANLADLELERLKTALNAMDISTANRLLMDYAALPLSDEVKNAVSEIERLILLFEYDAAIVKIDALLLEQSMDDTSHGEYI
ncbi:MAG: response regulator [Oscillospiraceae bacterium]|jgi:signal transduction histidine kinase/CheY-like chemotaxis protein|nr:response regulator [Oscillospiraceae bacterium]